jgi:hypothetical protein
MIFNTNYTVKDKHAFLSPSKYHWVNYDLEKLKQTYDRHQAAMKGTRLHNLAAELIEMGIKLPKNKKTMNQYVNDAVGFKMSPEVPLYYSDNCFGTADAISFHKNTLRVHDLKTGVSKASFHQLEIYVALFSLEYGIKLKDMEIILRIYQNNEIIQHTPEKEAIQHVIDKIMIFDKEINKIKLGE